MSQSPPTYCIRYSRLHSSLKHKSACSNFGKLALRAPLKIQSFKQNEAREKNIDAAYD